MLISLKFYDTDSWASDIEFPCLRLYVPIESFSDPDFTGLSRKIPSIDFGDWNVISLTRYRNWWFASTAIPLLAATIGPLANVLSIAALVNKWRVILPNDGKLPEGTDDNGVGIPE